MTTAANIPEWEMRRRKNIAAGLMGKTLSREHRANIAAGHVGKKLSAEHKAKIGAAHRGMKRSEETRRRISAANKGQIPSAAAIAATKARQTGLKMTPEQRLKKSAAAPRGENHPRWKGGVSSENARTRQSVEGRLWREAVFARDNHTCQACGKRGGDLNAHHLKEFSKFHDVRFELSNGQTLCVPCHRAVHRKRAN